MKTEFSRDTYHAYMILEPDPGQTAGYEEQMLVNQDTDYLLRFHPQETDGVKKYYYEITGMLDFVSCVNRREVSVIMLRGMLRSICGCCDAMNEYLLRPDSLMMIPDRIYMDVDMTKMHFAYVPGYQGDFRAGLRELSDCLLSAADHKDKECVMLVYAFYKIVREEDFSAASIRKLLGAEKQEEDGNKGNAEEGMTEAEYEQGWHAETEREEKEEQAAEGRGRRGLRNKKHVDLCTIGLYAAGAVICLTAALAYRFGWLQGVSAAIGLGEKYILAAILFMAAAVLFVMMKMIGLRRNADQKGEEDRHEFSDEDFWKESDYPGGHYEFVDWSDYESDHTVVLTAGKGVRMISMNKNIAEDVLLSSFPAVLGAHSPEAQVILPYTGISRKHAFLEEEGGRYYLTDLGSTNGTWLNGERLRPDEKKVLVNEDLVIFADVSFMFMAVGAGGGGK